MKIELLKQILEQTGTSDVNKVYFDQRHITNTDREKDYPYVLWDLNTFNSEINWQKVAAQEETVTMTAYCIGYFDAEAQAPVSPMTREEKFDELREAFREYLSVILTSDYVSVTNLARMRNELFQIGITLDAEIGVSFTVTMKLFCNTSPPLPD